MNQIQHMQIMKNQTIIDFVLNQNWEISQFDKLNLSKLSKEEQNLFQIARILKTENKTINAEQIYLKTKDLFDSAFATKILLLYMLKEIQLDRFNFKTKNRKPHASNSFTL